MSGHTPWWETRKAWFDKLTPEQRELYRKHSAELDEEISRARWEDRIREWLSGQVGWVSASKLDPFPIAPEGIPEDWRWTNWQGYTEEEALLVATVRSYGCKCVYPLLGWTTKEDVEAGFPDTPRCRTCNTDVDDSNVTNVLLR